MGPSMLTLTFETPEALVTAAADALRDAFQAVSPTPAAVMLSGGGTPLPVYAEVARRGGMAAPNVTAFFSDERMVPLDSPESNYGAARPMFLALGLEQNGRALAAPTALPLDDAAAAYEDRLRGLITPPGRVSLGILGVGADGHTASLFSPEDVLRGRGRLAIPVPRAQGPDRVSVTGDFLARVERLIFLVAGPEKASVAAILQNDPTQLIAGQAVVQCERVELWTAGLGA